jgi:hypothetical protein
VRESPTARKTLKGSTPGAVTTIIPDMSPSASPANRRLTVMPHAVIKNNYGVTKNN